MTLKGLGGHQLIALGQLPYRITFAGREKDVTMIILPDDAISLPCILGLDFLKIFGIKLKKCKRKYTASRLKEQELTCQTKCKLNNISKSLTVFVLLSSIKDVCMLQSSVFDWRAALLF